MTTAATIFLATVCVLLAAAVWRQSRHGQQMQNETANLELKLMKLRRDLQKAKASSSLSASMAEREHAVARELASRQTFIETAAAERFRQVLMALDTNLARRLKFDETLDARELQVLGRKREGVQTILQTLITNRLDEDLISAAQELANATDGSPNMSREELIRARVKAHLSTEGLDVG